MNQKCNNFDLISTNSINMEKFNNFKQNTNINDHNDDEDENIESRDVVDFVKPDVCPPCDDNKIFNNKSSKSPQLLSKNVKKSNISSLYGDIEVKSCVKSSISNLEKLPIFQFQRKKSDPTANNTVAAKIRPKFVKSASIARLLGNTYSTKRVENLGNNGGTSGCTKTRNNTSSSSLTTTTAERFQKCSEQFSDEVQMKDFCEEKDISARAFRTISKGISKLLWRRSHSVDISTPDPEYKVSYLGNVLTGWAKGENCMEKPLATLWRNYTQNNKPDVVMRVRVCPSGLKATTRQHGLTEYWSHRITQCTAPKNYPRVFCWIYRHEGRKLKHELRCHAVLCAKETISDDISKTLKENLSRALSEFKRDKINRQNARLSLVNSVYDNPSMPRRKILLSVGANNYRPPLERSKSAPRLMSIEEAIGEEDDEENECGDRGNGGDNESNTKVRSTNESRTCCDIDPLYPAMTLGRRRCRKGHSIRRTGNRSQRKTTTDTMLSSCNENETMTNDINTDERAISRIQSLSSTNSDDDLDKLLVCHNYDTKSPLAGELLSYFDMKFCSKAISLNDLDDDHYDTLSADEIRMNDLVGRHHLHHQEPQQRTALSLDDLDQYDDEDVFYSQDNILDILAKESKKHSTNNTDDYVSMKNNGLLTNQHVIRHSALLQHDDIIKPLTNCSISTNSHQMVSLDSDEGSISSGCETASTVTTTNFDELSQTTNDKDYMNGNCDDGSMKTVIVSTIKRNGKTTACYKGKTKSDDSDSEFSDESGYVEYQESNRSKVVLI